MSAFPLWRWGIATNSAVSRPLHHVQTNTHTIVFQQDAYIYEMNWPHLKEAKPQHEAAATFGEGIQMLGFDLNTGDSIDLILYWTDYAIVLDSYDVFVHLLDKNGQIVAQTDQKPVGGLAATNVWQPGDIIRESLKIMLPSDVPPGKYDLVIGVYLRESVQRLTILGDKVTDNALILASLTLP